MSIWCTILDFSDDDHAEDCARWVACSRAEADANGLGMYGGDLAWRYDDSRPCTCAAGPLAYQKSHVVPTAADPRAGNFDLASIAAHIGPDHDYRDEDGTHQPYLRIGLRGSDAEPDVVVLDEAKVRQVFNALWSWLANVDKPPAVVDVHLPEQDVTA